MEFTGVPLNVVKLAPFFTGIYPKFTPRATQAFVPLQSIFTHLASYHNLPPSPSTFLLSVSVSLLRIRIPFSPSPYIQLSPQIPRSISQPFEIVTPSPTTHQPLPPHELQQHPTTTPCCATACTTGIDRTLECGRTCTPRY